MKVGMHMARRSQPSNVPEELRQSLVELLTNFAEELQKEDLREKVVALVPAFHKLRDLGSSLIPQSEAASARERIIAYLKQYPRVVIDGDELMVVSGINEWARRVRELRVQFGWWIYSGVTFNQMAQNPDDEAMFRTIGINPKTIRPDQYVLMREEQDRDAAHRWNVLNEIRKKKVPVKEKIIEYLRKNVGTPVTGEELSYLAGDTKDPIRVAVLERDGFKCTCCGWSRDKLNRDDPRKMLELHHKQQHKDGGENTVENLITLCNVCHDAIHRQKE